MANVTFNFGSLITSENQKARSNVYSDLNSELTANANKTNIIRNNDANSVLGSLKNLFTFKPGERILEPEYGLNLSEFLYQQMNDKTAQSIGLKIFNGIKKWEPRVSIRNINVYPDYDDNTYYITIKFTIARLSNEKEYEFNHALRKSL